MPKRKESAEISFDLRRFSLFFLSLIVAALVQTSAKAEDEEETAFTVQARKLAPSTPQAERLAALQWLVQHCSEPAATKVMPDVERCLKKDADATVRFKAVETLGLIARDRKPRVCPLAVAEALQDGDLEVRRGALPILDLFREFAPGTVEILLRCAKEGDPELRAGVMMPLATAAGQEEKVIKLIRKATEDSNFLICNNAHAALYKITGKLEDIVPYCLRVQLEFHNLPSLPRGESDEKKWEAAHKRLMQWSWLARLRELEDKQGEELAKIVQNQLDQPSPSARRAAAFVIGAYPELLESLKRDAPSFLPIPGDQKQKKNTAPPCLLDRLRTIKVEDRLRKLAKDDPDEKVRKAAIEALEKLVGRKGKRP